MDQRETFRTAVCSIFSVPSTFTFEGLGYFLAGFRAALVQSGLPLEKLDVTIQAFREYEPITQYFCTTLGLDALASLT